MQARSRGDERERGFTLIELMIALAISGIVAGLVAGSVAYVNSSLVQQFDAVQARQEGRAALQLLELYLRQAGSGIERGVNWAGTGGIVPIGYCKGSDGTRDMSCDNVDSGTHVKSDRLGLAFVNAGTPAVPVKFANGQIGFGKQGCAFLPPGHPFPDDTRVLLSGICADETRFGKVVQVESIAVGADDDLCVKYQWDDTSEATRLPCTQSKTGELYASRLPDTETLHYDFYVDTAAVPPRLMLDDNTGNAPMEVAFNVEALQVQYGIDSDFNGDIEAWCDDVTASSCLGGNGAGNIAHARGIRVAVVVRTPGTRATQANSASVFNSGIIGTNTDGHRRWVYRSTVFLRNR